MERGPRDKKKKWRNEGLSIKEEKRVTRFGWDGGYYCTAFGMAGIRGVCRIAVGGGRVRVGERSIKGWKSGVSFFFARSACSPQSLWTPAQAKGAFSGCSGPVADSPRREWVPVARQLPGTEASKSTSARRASWSQGPRPKKEPQRATRGRDPEVSVLSLSSKFSGQECLAGRTYLINPFLTLASAAHPYVGQSPV